MRNSLLLMATAIAGLLIMGLLGVSIKNRNTVINQSELLDASRRLASWEAVIIRELFLLDENKKRNFSDLTEAQKAYAAAFRDSLDHVAAGSAALKEAMSDAYEAERLSVETYKTNWSIARNSQRSVLRHSRAIKAQTRSDSAMDAYGAVTEIISYMHTASVTDIDENELSALINTVDGYVAAAGSQALSSTWIELNRHLGIFKSANAAKKDALAAFSTTELVEMSTEAMRELSERNARTHAQEVSRTNTTFLAASVFLVLILALLVWLNAALRHKHTQNERLDAAVKARTQELETSLEKIQRLAEAKSSFLANMSHEIRTPMNGVIGMSDLLAETPLTRDQSVYVRTIKESSEALLTVINDILDLSKAESNQMRLETHPFRLDDILENLVQLTSVTAKMKNVEVIFRYPPQAATGFLGDGGRLRQVLMNIVGNAIKFTKEGHVAIDVRCAVENANADLSIIVSDTGIGIDESMLSTIFDAFIQADNSSRREFQGTGLGLAISKRFIEAMGGTITVASTLNVGSTFTINLTLPVVAIERASKDATADLSKLPPMKILMVDDIELNRRIFVERFRLYGHDVVTADNAGEALALLARPEHAAAPFSLAFLDYQMPAMDGLELARRIRADHASLRLPIIMLSSVNGISALPDCQGISHIQYLDKPAPSNLLADAVFRALDVNAKAGLQRTAPSSVVEKFGAGVKLLVVEDTKTNQLVIRKIAEKAGFDIVFANNGEEGVDAFRKEAPDLILMDWSMPVMSGLEATRLIRGIELKTGAEAIPIIGLSANAMQEHAEEGLRAGMNAYLTKPIKRNDLLEALRLHAPQEPRPAPHPEAQPAQAASQA